MKIRIALIAVVLISLLFMSGCELDFSASDGIEMPYSSDEYENLGWSVEELKEHFKELGFDDINTSYVYETFDASEARICRVAIEDPYVDSWFTEYRDFEKGETLKSYHEVLISAYTLIPTITVENSTEFAELLQIDNESPDKQALMDKFINAHKGDYIEFDGTITWWSDEYWYIGEMSISVEVDNSNQTEFNWYCYMSDLGLEGDYHYTKYQSGMITEGMRVHIITYVDYVDGECELKISKFELID